MWKQVVGRVLGALVVLACADVMRVFVSTAHEFFGDLLAFSLKVAVNIIAVFLVWLCISEE